MQAIFLVFSKAFNTNNYDILLGELEFYNFSNSAIALIKSYLSNRKQFVEIDSLGSDLQPITPDVPLGPVLGPLLFLIFINHVVHVLLLLIIYFLQMTPTQSVIILCAPKMSFSKFKSGVQQTNSSSILTKHSKLFLETHRKN